jgi:hypothetical protein
MIDFFSEMSDDIYLGSYYSITVVVTSVTVAG